MVSAKIPTPEESRARIKAMGTKGVVVPEPPTSAPEWDMEEITKLVAEIRATDFPDQKWVVPGILPAGLAMLYGEPKLGKSVLVLQLAGAVGGGGMFLGERCEQGSVLYFALEDYGGSIKDRTAEQRWTEDMDYQVGVVTSGGELIAKAGYLETGLAEKIRGAIIKHEYRLVIIDVLGSVFKGDLNVYKDIMQGLEPIKTVAKETNCCILLVHHPRKTGVNKDSSSQGALGSIAITGKVDTILVMTRESTGRVLLVATGRYLKESPIELDIEHNGNFGWALSEGEFTDREQRVIDAMKGQPPLTKADIARLVGDTNRGPTSRVVDGLVKQGFLAKDGKYYSIEERSFFDGKPIFD